MKRLIFIMALLFSGYTSAFDKCRPNLTNTDVCIAAKKIVSEVSQQLPITMSGTTTMYHISSDENVVIALVRMSLTEEDMLQVAKKNNINPGQIKSNMVEMTKSGVCSQQNPLKSFINLGGEMQYVYTHPSGRNYNTVNISSCD